MQNALKVLAVVLFVAGCASVPPAAPPPPPQPPSPPPPPAVVETPRLTAGLTQIQRDQVRVAANGGSAVVILRGQPKTAYENLMVCEAVKRAIPQITVEQVAVGVGRENRQLVAYRPVYWLSDGGPPLAASCADLIRFYDFSRAEALRAKYKLTGAGPYLLVVRADETQAATIDLANKRAADIDRYVAMFEKGFAYEHDIWDPAVNTDARRKALAQEVFAGGFRDALLQAFSLASAPAADAACALGSDAAC